MKTRTYVGDRTERIGIVASLFLVGLVVACASADGAKSSVEPSRANIDLTRVGRLLIAGFVPIGMEQIDLNRETARLLRMELRKTSVQVIKADPLHLDDVPRPEARSVSGLDLEPYESDRDRPNSASAWHADALFTNVSYWKRLGEEYASPLILTGTVAFEPAAPRSQPRIVGPRVVRRLQHGFSLRLQLVFIRGATGEIIDSVRLPPRTAYGSGRNLPLVLYFQLMDQMMPSILSALEQQVSHASSSTALVKPPPAAHGRASWRRLTMRAGVVDD